MELISVNLTAFRRFQATETLKTQGKLVAIIGPNEAGKSSILEALKSLDNDEPLSPRVTSWDSNPSSTEIEAVFRLKDQEAKAIFPGTKLLRIVKKTEGMRRFLFEPPIRRDWSMRDRLADRLKDTIGKASFRDLAQQLLDKNEIDVTEKFSDLMRKVSVDRESLPDETVGQISTFVEEIRTLITIDSPKYLIKLLDDLERLHQFESLAHPSEAAAERVKDLIPAFAYFSEAMRIIEDSYVVSEVISEMPPALSNILQLAEININDLYRAAQAADVAAVRTIEDRANLNLDRAFSQSWSQSEIVVRIAYDSGNIKILIQDTSRRYSEFSERSDGLRQFVALLTFLAQTKIENPILLIDEIEQRLHYDAQADLIQVLNNQDVADKIIYTTHSAGSLPEDLGLGVHVVMPKADSPHLSRVNNRFWEGESVGFSPLLVGMGASTLAFFPTRRAVVAEGPSDMILLPMLFRDALEAANLDFQVVPGLSSVSRSQLPALNANGSHVCYLIDSDSGAGGIVALLKSAGVTDRLILELKVGKAGGFSLEDFVHPDILLQAANKIGSTWGANFVPFGRSGMPSANRVAWIRESLRSAGVERFSKVDLAYSVADIVEAEGSRPCDPRRREALKTLALKISGVLHEQTLAT